MRYNFKIEGVPKFPEHVCLTAWSTSFRTQVRGLMIYLVQGLIFPKSGTVYCPSDLKREHPLVMTIFTICIRYIVAVWNRRNPPTYCNSLTSYITQCCIEYTSPWVLFELTTLMAIGTDSVNPTTIRSFATSWWIFVSCFPKWLILLNMLMHPVSLHIYFLLFYEYTSKIYLLFDCLLL